MQQQQRRAVAALYQVDGRPAASVYLQPLKPFVHSGRVLSILNTLVRA